MTSTSADHLVLEARDGPTETKRTAHVDEENFIEDMAMVMQKGLLLERLKAEGKGFVSDKGVSWKKWLGFFLPCMSWISTYNTKNNLVTDVIAGLSVGAMIVPQSIAYAGIAKLPAQIGLFSATVPIYFYTLFGTCKELAPGPTALNAIMVGSILPPYVPGLPNNPNAPEPEEIAAQARLNALAVQTALACAILYTIIGVFRLGFLTSFLSHSVTSGFTTAAGIFIIAAQFKYLSGIKVKKPCSTVIQYVVEYAQHMEMFNWKAFVIGSLLCAGLTLMKKLGTKFKKLKMLKALGPLIVAVTGITLSIIFKFEKIGIKTVKKLPAGLPKATFNAWNKVEDWNVLLSIAWSITFIGLIEGVSTARTISTKLKYDVDANKEIVAFGAVNFANAAFSGYPGSGSMVRSAVAVGTGCKSQVYSMVTATIVMISLLVLTKVFEFMPLCALAAIVISGCFSLLEFGEMIYLAKSSKVDLFNWMVAFWCTFCFGLKDGVIISLTLSLLIVLSRSAFPKVQRYGQVGGVESDEYRPIGPTTDGSDEARINDEIVILAADQAIFFANSLNVKDKMYKLAKRADTTARASGKRLRYVIFDISSSPYVDSTVMHMLLDAVQYFGEMGVRFCLAGPNATVRNLLRRGKVVDKVGERYVFATVHQADVYCCDTIRSGKEEEIHVAVDDH